MPVLNGSKRFALLVVLTLGLILGLGGVLTADPASAQTLGPSVRIQFAGPGGSGDTSVPVADDGTVEADFGITRFGSYSWSIFADDGELLAQGVIVVDEAEEPCDAGTLQVGGSCAGVTHENLDGSPSFLTFAIRGEPATAEPSTTSTAAVNVDDEPDVVTSSDGGSNLWLVVVVIGLLLLLLSVFLTWSPSSRKKKGPPPPPPPPPTPPAAATPPPAYVPPKPPKPVCRIEVEATRIPAVRSLPVYHLCVVYYDANGKPTYFRGGPGRPPSPGKPHGNITAISGPHVPGAVDWSPGCPSIVVAEGPHVCGKDKLLATEIKRINTLLVTYAPFGPNSNTTARRLLKAAGVPEKKPVTIAPGWGDKDLDPRPTSDIAPVTGTTRGR